MGDGLQAGTPMYQHRGVTVHCGSKAMRARFRASSQEGPFMFAWRRY